MLRGETRASVRAGFMDSPATTSVPRAKHIGSLRVQASVSLSQTNDSVSVR
jgi:hypothetical protein